jgi:hypothetical protein
VNRIEAMATAEADTVAPLGPWNAERPVACTWAELVLAGITTAGIGGAIGYGLGRAHGGHLQPRENASTNAQEHANLSSSALLEVRSNAWKS